MALIVRVFTPIILAVLVGVILRLVRVADDRWVHVFNEYGLFVGFPALIFLEISAIAPAAVAELVPMLLVNIAILVGVFFLTHGVLSFFSLAPSTRHAFALMAFFGNVAYIGYPVVTRAFEGSGGTVSLVMASYSVTMFTLGIGSLEIAKAGRVRPATIVVRIVTNPFIVAIALGLLFSLARLALPEPVRATISMLGLAATPMVLMAIGIFLMRRHRIRGLFSKVAALSVVRLVAVPLLVYLVVRGALTQMIVPQNGAIQILEAAMPVGITTFALGSRYPVDQEFVVAAILATTLLSAVTLPLWLAFLV